MTIGNWGFNLHRGKAAHRRSEALRIDRDSKLWALEFVSIGSHFNDKPLAPFRNLNGPHIHTDKNLLPGRIVDARGRTMRWTLRLDLS